LIGSIQLAILPTHQFRLLLFSIPSVAAAAPRLSREKSVAAFAIADLPEVGYLDPGENALEVDDFRFVTQHYLKKPTASRILMCIS
jgi:hypothetical protein